MRADRLLSILLLLQTRGRMTADQLAQELDVSVRTIYRDIDGLSGAGIPVYTEKGPGGGCMLLDSYRTNLNGLNADEVQALFMLSIPTPLDDLGMTGELKAALLKVKSALPAPRQAEQNWIQQRLYLDPTAWSPPEKNVPFLQTIQQAVWEDRQIMLKVQLIFDTTVERVICPYGLVSKADVWYLIAQVEGGMRVYRLDQVMEARICDSHFSRDSAFHLEDVWQDWCKRHTANRPSILVGLRLAPALFQAFPRYLRSALREAMEQAGPADESGWREVWVEFDSFHAAREAVLGMGSAVEVLAPLALRKSVIDFASEISRLYQNLDR